MRIVGYILAVVIGVAAIVAGFAAKQWWLAGFGLGFLVISIWRIAAGGQARVQGERKAIFAIFDMPIWPDGVISIAIIVVAEVVVFLIFKLLQWA